jgi:predicted nucleotidyltransferase
MTMAELRRRRDEILDIARNRGISDVQVFGSVARGDSRPDSDVDFLVEVEPGRTILDLGGFLDEVAELLGRPVHVVSSGGLSGSFGSHVRAEATPL